MKKQRFLESFLILVTFSKVFKLEHLATMQVVFVCASGQFALFCGGLIVLSGDCVFTFICWLFPSPKGNVDCVLFMHFDSSCLLSFAVMSSAGRLKTMMDVEIDE